MCFKIIPKSAVCSDLDNVDQEASAYVSLNFTAKRELFTFLVDAQTISFCMNKLQKRKMKLSDLNVLSAMN